MTLFELKEKMANLQAAIEEDAKWIADKAADPSVDMKDIEAKKAHRDEIQKRYELIKAEHDQMEAKQKAALENKPTEKMDDKSRAIKAKAAFYRDVLTGQTVGKTYEGLGAIPANNADLGYGDKLLPTNMSNQLIMEPVQDNPLRGICHMTNITGLEEPKLGFTIEDDDVGDITDKETADEIEMTGDTVAYGRHKMKVKATVKDTVLHGADVDLVGAIDENLRSALAYREKLFAFLPAETCGTDTVHAHMSFYKQTAEGAYEIKEVTGEDMYNAIVNAYADLNDKYAANARVVMRKADYYAMIKGLTNTSEALFSDKPAMILGIPVVFCDKATTPVVGDFSYYGINYDIGTIYDNAKDVDTGDYKFVLTAWGDQQIRLKSAFRLATVEATP